MYGVVLTTPHRFANHLPETDVRADLWVRPVAEPPLPRGWADGEPCYRSLAKIDPQQHFLDVIRTPTATVFRFNEVVDFFVFDDGIAYQAHDPAYAYMVELHLLGTVLAYWQERAGRPALHASAVVVDGHAIAFLASHGGGKTSLAATLLRRGHPLASDDLVTLEPHEHGVIAYPGYPQLRMWPDQARHFLGHDRLERVNPNVAKLRVPVGPGGIGGFDGAPRPLAALYLPRRGDGRTLEIAPMPGAAALFELMRQSFLPNVVEGTGLATARLATLAAVLERVPLRLLTYPSGLDQLPAVADWVAADARVLAASAHPAPASTPSNPSR